MGRNPKSKCSVSVVRVHRLTDRDQEKLEDYVGLELNRGHVQQIPQDRIEVRDSDNEIHINGIVANVVSYQIIVPGKVVGTRFKDGGTEKVVLQEGDTFNIDDAIRISIAKHVGKKFYNLKGLENLATRLSYLKCIDKMIIKLHKQHKRDLEAEEKRLQEAKEAKEREKRRKKKAIEKRRRKAKNRYQESLDTTQPSTDNCECKRHEDIDTEADYKDSINSDQCSVYAESDDDKTAYSSTNRNRLNIRIEKHKDQ